MITSIIWFNADWLVKWDMRLIPHRLPFPRTIGIIQRVTDEPQTGSSPPSPLPPPPKHNCFSLETPNMQHPHRTQPSSIHFLNLHNGSLKRRAGKGGKWEITLYLIWPTKVERLSTAYIVHYRTWGGGIIMDMKMAYLPCLPVFWQFSTQTIFSTMWPTSGWS